MDIKLKQIKTNWEWSVLLKFLVASQLRFMEIHFRQRNEINSMQFADNRLVVCSVKSCKKIV